MRVREEKEEEGKKYKGKENGGGSRIVRLRFFIP